MMKLFRWRIDTRYYLMTKLEERWNLDQDKIEIWMKLLI